MRALTASTTQSLFESIDAYEIELVSRTASACNRLHLQRIARTTTRLGNGWLYPLLSLFVIATRIEQPLRVVASCASSVVISFLVYPMLKRFLGRTRPCDYDPSLARDLEPLDHYSCPSGHAMTAAAYAVPLAFACPPALPLAIALCALVSWSRVALGHHYVSDVGLGTMLGGVAAGAVISLAY